MTRRQAVSSTGQIAVAAISILTAQALTTDIMLQVLMSAPGTLAITLVMSTWRRR
jgi:hypothetical protein